MVNTLRKSRLAFLEFYSSSSIPLGETAVRAAAYENPFFNGLLEDVEDVSDPIFFNHTGRNHLRGCATCLSGRSPSGPRASTMADQLR